MFALWKIQFNEMILSIQTYQQTFELQKAKLPKLKISQPMTNSGYRRFSGSANKLSEAEMLAYKTNERLIVNLLANVADWGN